MKDFTPAQAERWITQEFAKCPTPDIVRMRLESEERMMAMIEGTELAKGLPNSLNARKRLIEALHNAAKTAA